MATAWERPRSVAEACSMLAAGGSSLRAAAGCTAVPPSELVSDRSVAGVVDLLALDALSGIEGTASGLRIGATTTIAALGRAEAVRERAPMLAEVAAGVGDEVLREAATVGGNVAARVPRQYEFAIAMVALDASMEVASTEGTRTIAAAELCDRSFELGAGELILGFEVPRSHGYWTYRKLTTNLGSYGIAALAISVPAAERSPRVIAGLGESIPQPLPAAAEALASGGWFDPGAVAEEATRDLAALDDGLASAAYRRRALKATVRGELERIANRSGAR